ncbi:hypothetical protein QVD17_05885 [Tagetes erecta]|uniref:Uncharacterized protein n=1 Tax=Tagetes erecta TaxID=13708 RepID=A0AAD8LCT3_TARER|nr:hypothetical protein QVD17_05885 [Tagetes erecta]
MDWTFLRQVYELKYGLIALYTFALCRLNYLDVHFENPGHLPCSAERPELDINNCDTLPAEALSFSRAHHASHLPILLEVGNDEPCVEFAGFENQRLDLLARLAGTQPMAELSAPACLVRPANEVRVGWWIKDLIGLLVEEQQGPRSLLHQPDHLTLLKDVVPSPNNFSSILTPHPIHVPKHQGTAAGQPLQLCVAPPFIGGGGQPPFVLPSHIPVSQPPYPDGLDIFETGL